MKKNIGLVITCLFMLMVIGCSAEPVEADPAVVGEAVSVSPIAALITTFLPLLFISIIPLIVILSVKHHRSRHSKSQNNASLVQDPLEELKKLAKLNQDGIISDEEFSEAAKKLLNQ